MDLATTQAVLSRLYTDADFRKLFSLDPQAALKTMGLEEEDALQIATLKPQQLRFFAHSLIRKRLGEIKKLLPLTRYALGEVFDPLFRSYAANNRLESGEAHQKDAVRFCWFVHEHARAELSGVPWGIDALRFEAAHLESTIRGRYLSVKFFRYPVQAGAGRITEAGSMPKRATLAIWLRFRSSGPLRFLAIGNPFR
jgi:hypothetical protein